MFDVQKVKDDCVQQIREFFEQNGKGCNAVVGISGGKDSSIVAADALRLLSISLRVYRRELRLSEKS